MQETIYGMRNPCPCDTPLYTVMHFQGYLPATKLLRYSRIINKLQQSRGKINLRQMAEDEAESQGFKLGVCPFDKENK